MNKTYVILTSILILFAFGLTLLPESNKSDDIKPELLLNAINSNSRYLSADLVAERLINEDPSILLVDVRPFDQSSSYTLPGALSIPLDELLMEDWQSYFEQDAMDVVFYSNSDLQADQAWILCTRKGYKNLYVMKGGLNNWFSNIMQPVAPAATDPSEAFDLYSFRKAASIYFGGSSAETDNSATVKEPVTVIKRKKKTISEGGC